ncbi:MAG: N-acetyltransferase [Bacteroidota bacterium]|nr:N-acetyltransferase [Bacteroidota bacterium]
MEIMHDESGKKFYFNEDGKKGHLIYQKIKQNVLDYKSTYIDEEIRGSGYGKELVKFALEYAKNNNYKIIPSCRMVSIYIARNKEYENLVSAY